MRRWPAAKASRVLAHSCASVGRFGRSPGRDVFDTEVDDVLAPERQAEIAQVVAVLKRFRPTKIAVEAAFDDDRVAGRYSDYLNGSHELTSNETEQFGFRVAKELGHQTIYPVDVDGELPFPRLVKHAKASGRTTELDVLQRETGGRVEELASYLASHTVLETLLVMNSDERAAEDVASYFRLARFGEPWDRAGADLVSDWFRRNLLVSRNVVRLVDSANERMLVVLGAGNLGWLR